MILIYFVVLLLSGYLVVNLFPISSRLSKWGHVAFVPFFASLIPTIIMIISSLIGLELSRQKLLWILSLFIIFLLSVKYIVLKESFKSLIQHIRKVNKKTKFLFLLAMLSILGLILRNVTREIWPGDGMSHWAMRALEWGLHGKYELREHFLNFYKTWINYPLYHTAGMAFNHILFPEAAPYMINSFDTLYAIGLLLSGCYFFSLFLKDDFSILLASIVSIFSCRDLFQMVNSGYAEIDMAYFLLLIICLLFEISNKTKNFVSNEILKKFGYSFFILLGLVMGALSITKNEGIPRLGIILIVFLFLCWRNHQNIPWQGLLISLTIPIIFIVCNKIILSSYNSDYQPYYSSINLTLASLKNRFFLVTKGLYYSYKYTTHGISKMFWPLSFIMLPFSLSYLYKLDRHRYYQAEFLMVAFFLNTLFNILPSWLAPLSIDPNLDIPSGLAKLTLIRLNVQIAPLIGCLNGMALFLLIKTENDFLQKIKNKIDARFNKSRQKSWKV